MSYTQTNKALPLNGSATRCDCSGRSTWLVMVHQTQSSQSSQGTQHTLRFLW